MRQIRLILALFLTVVFAASCRSFYITDTKAKNIDTSQNTSFDPVITKMVTPYRLELEASMNIVVAELVKDLIKEQPESTLGNHIAHITHYTAEKHFDRQIDFGIINYGGLRVPSINKGPLHVGDAYQIMPFDNYVVVMELEGAVIQEIMDQMAENGGWPIHLGSYVIENDKATSLKIRGEAIVMDKTYSMAITDYLANGGDYLAVLKEHSYENTGILQRDAIIDYWKEITAQGLKVEVVKDGRVTKK